MLTGASFGGLCQAGAKLADSQPERLVRTASRSQEVRVGEVNATVSYSAIMPEVLVRRGNKFLLVKGREGEKTFWWPPGAYWMNAGTCDLRETDPGAWIKTTLMDQIKTDVKEVSLRGVSLIDINHAPVLIYSATIDGEPKPNPSLGFDEAGFFAFSEFPDNIGRDKVHGRWLRNLVGNFG